MKILEVPILNDDGSLQYTATLTPQELITLVQFALNFTASVGLGVDAKHRANKQIQDDVEEEEHILQ